MDSSPTLQVRVSLLLASGTAFASATGAANCSLIYSTPSMSQSDII